MVAVEGLGDTDTVGALELARLTGAARTIHHLVLTLHTVLDAITHQAFVNAGIAAGQFVGLTGKRVSRASSFHCNQNQKLLYPNSGGLVLHIT